MKMKSFYGLILFGLLMSTSIADTFKHKETGETFTGFPTQKVTGSQTRVYNSEAKKFVSINLAEYDVERNAQGRRETVMLIPITQPESLISQTVAEQIAQSIISASNAGPLAIMVQIDSPGGSGENMKIIANAIMGTSNCPVVAYISGGTYGGAFNSAAAAALACEKVFIAPTASIGAVGSFSNGTQSSEDYKNYLSLYAPDSLVTYNTYVAALAQRHNRPGVLARGLIDKKVTILEVNNIDGSRDFILKSDRQPAQSIVRTVAEGMSPSVQSSGEDTGAETRATDIAGSVLNLTAADAVKAGLADEIAASKKDVLNAMQIANAHFTSSQSEIESTVKKFAAAKRTIATGLTQIQRLEEDAGQLDAALKQVQEQLRTGTQTREIYQQGTSTQREQFPNNYDRYYNSDRTGNTSGRSRNERTSRFRPLQRERITTIEPMMSPEAIQGQLSTVLRELVSEYRRVINLAKRWPGGLPPELPLSTLEKNLISAETELDNLYRYNRNYPNQVVPNQLGRRGY